MSCRGKAHSGTCAIAVAGLLCGLNAASRPLYAQPLPDRQLGAEAFEERFSSGLRADPIFTHPAIQSLLASLPSWSGDGESTASAASFEASAPMEFSLAELWGPVKVLDDPLTLHGEVLISETEPPAPEPEAQESASSEPQPPESTASVAVEELQILPLPPPADVVFLPDDPVPPPEAPAMVESPPQVTPQPPAPPPSPQPEIRTANARSTPSRPAVRQSAPKARTSRRAVRTKEQQVAQNRPDGVETTGSIARCPAGATCASQPQFFPVFLGFLIGGLLGGPGGAMVGGAAGALLSAQGTPSGAGSSPAHGR